MPPPVPSLCPACGCNTERPGFVCSQKTCYLDLENAALPESPPPPPPPPHVHGPEPEPSSSYTIDADGTHPYGATPEPPEPPRRKRGRPRKHPVE